MNSNLRNSGIDIIGSIPWGTHIGQLYSSKTDFCDIGAPYIQSGLMNNELCIWIYSQNTSYEEVKDIISERIENVDTYLESGQLKIIPHTEWYIKDNSFNDVRVNKQWNDLVIYALEKGFDGLRAIADTFWLEKSYLRDFSNYECNINKNISELPFIVICLYDVNKIDAFETAEIVNNHCYVIVRHENNLELIKNVELLIKDKQLEESEEKYKKLIQLLPDSVFIHDAKRILYCNESAVHITGVKDAHELMGRTMLELVSPEMEHSFRRFIDETLDGSTDPNYFQCKFVCNNDEIKSVELVATRYYLNGYTLLLSVVRDVTPFKKINELERDIEKKSELLNNTIEYDKIKTEFFSNISHELKTPLNVILATIQLLKTQKDQGYKDMRESKYLKIMQQNCYRLLRLVNNLIDITKIDSNYYEIRPQNYNIVGLVEGIAMSVAEYAMDKGINIIFDTNTEEKVMACDPDQIERIILNLLSNAIKFTQSGGSIWVTMLDQREKILITIKDTGIGIPLDKQECVFKRFQQVDKSLTRQHEGSGIGLSLVKALVEKHGGKISLNSELGKGTEFTIEIPCNTLMELENNASNNQNLSKQNYVERINIEFSDIYS